MFDITKLADLTQRGGWKKAELARRAGLTPQQWHKLASGEKRDPTVWTLQRVAKAVGCTLEQLVNDTPPAPRKQPTSKARKQQRK